jgi:hypothetical protein
MTDGLLTRAVSRREFNHASLTALFVGMTVWVGACGGKGSSNNGYVSSPTPTPTPTSGSTTPTSSDRVGAISENHGHSATVTSVEMQAAGAVSLHIQGTADHDHTVDLSASEVAQVAAGTRVSKTSTQSGSSNDGYGNTTPAHNHTVTFN